MPSTSRILAVLSILSVTLATTGGPAAGSFFTISPKAFPSLCAVPSGSDDGTNIALADCNSCDAEWSFDGKSIHHVSSSKCWDVTDGGQWNSNKPQLWDCYAWNGNQMWNMANGLVKWATNDFCMDLTDGVGQTGTVLQIWQCFTGNENQQWVITELEDDDSTPATTTSSGASATASQTGIGGDLAAQGGSKASASATWPSASASASASWASASASPSSGASGSGNASVSTTSNADFSGYLQVSGTNVVDSNGNNVVLRGTNIGGWLVWEDWMCGITDNSGNADRFPQMTLDNRFGTDQTYELLNVWQDNWLVASDFDTLQGMGFNLVRIPFSYLNFIFPNGTYIHDSAGNIDFSRLDWAVQQAKARGIYVVFVYHIWDGQQDEYSTISEDSDDGQSQRNKAGQLWTDIAKHFAGEAGIAGFDMINEPTGSAGNLLQSDLYTAIRNGDSKRIIIMESISSGPDPSWTNVMYSMHEYNMMGGDEGSNQQQFWDGVSSDCSSYNSNGVPCYVGEFMASDGTLTWMLNQLNSMNNWWSGWTFKTVNMDRWGLENFGPDMSVTVSSDSFSSIQNAWSNMGSTTKSRVYDQYVTAAGGSDWKRSVPLLMEAKRETKVEQRGVVSPRVEVPGPSAGEVRRSHRHSHGGRSRRLVRKHGKGLSM